MIIGVKPDGTKERVLAIGDGYRESKASWCELLLDLKKRGLQAGPLLACGDGAMGFWSAMEEVFPQTKHQRCWFHKMGNVPQRCLPKSLVQGRTKKAMQDIWMAATRADALVAFNHFVDTHSAKYPKVTEKLTEDRDELLAFYDFPAEHWQHLRTTNPTRIDVCDGASSARKRTRNCVSRATFLGLAFKLIESAEESWRRIRETGKAGVDA